MGGEGGLQKASENCWGDNGIKHENEKNREGTGHLTNGVSSARDENHFNHKPLLSNTMKVERVNIRAQENGVRSGGEGIMAGTHYRGAVWKDSG